MSETPKEFLETSDRNWKPCIICGERKILQIRKALFSCLNCKQEFIADEDDMEEQP